jgi:putative oxidoreductase
MLRSLNEYFAARKEYGPVFIRIMAGFHLIYGVQDNILSWERMLEFRGFLEIHHFPVPLASALISVYAQFICGLLFIVGAWVRVAAALMVVNFLAAFTVHTNDPYPVFFPAIVMFSSALFLLFHGPGKLAIDREG